MEQGGVAMVYHRTFKPLGKMRRRVQNLRISSYSYLHTVGCGDRPDLSHNESVRLAVDCLLTQGVEAYHKMLSAEGEVDFLSDLEKSYILQNGSDGCTGAAPDASDDLFESLSVFSETALTYKMTSADSDVTLTPSRLNGVTSTNHVSDEATVQIYFQSDLRAAGIKDVVRNFIKRAKMALAIVMECFSDVELLCDILEACIKRNVSVHLLLDRSNLAQFVDMWHDLKLVGKNFPRVSVRSVVGHTYCARTGRRLTGQIAESFVISDWTEALTGTYSFSWLSGQVHRSHAVLLKGSAVLPFHQEFHRLNSSSSPVPGFATYNSVPQGLPLHIYNSVRAFRKDQDEPREAKPTWSDDTQTAAAQTGAETEPVAEIQSSASECTEDENNTQDLQLDLEPRIHADETQSASVGRAQDVADSSTTTDAKPPEQTSNQDSGSSDPLCDSLVSPIESELSGLTISSATGHVLDSNLQHHAAPLLSRQPRPPCLQTYIKPEAVNGRGVEGPAHRQSKRDGLFKALGTAVRPTVQKRERSCPPSFKPRVNLQSSCSQALSPSIAVKKDRHAGFLSFLTLAKEHILKPHKDPCSGTRAQDQPERHCQQSRFQPSRFQPRRTTESLVSAPALSVMGAQYQPGSMLLSPDVRAKRHLRFRPVARQTSVRSAFEAGQQAGSRPCLASLKRSLSLNDRRRTLHRLQEHD